MDELPWRVLIAGPAAKYLDRLSIEDRERIRTALLELTAGPHHVDGVTLDVDPTGREVVIDESEAPDTVAKTPLTEWLEVFNGHSLPTVVKDQTGVDSLKFATWCGAGCP